MAERKKSNNLSFVAREKKATIIPLAGTTNEKPRKKSKWK